MSDMARYVTTAPATVSVWHDGEEHTRKYAAGADVDPDAGGRAGALARVLVDAGYARPADVDEPADEPESAPAKPKTRRR